MNGAATVCVPGACVDESQSLADCREGSAYPPLLRRARVRRTAENRSI